MQFLTKRNVAALFGVDEHLVRRWIAEGWLPAAKGFRMGPHKLWRVQPEDLERFIRRYPQHYDRTRIEKGTYWRNLADEVWRTDPWLTVPEAAARLGVCRETVRRHLRRGWLRGERVLEAGLYGGWRVRERELATFEERHLRYAVIAVKQRWER
jgi:excisionase family DNA binding protein